MSSTNTNATAAWQVYGDEPMPRSYSVPWIVFSYIASLIGTWTTVELLHRQTSNKGLYNWFLLLAASIAMGGAAIWSMHFIGNQAIVMGDGSQHMRLSYSSAFTALSFVLPIIVVASSFLVFSLSTYPAWWNIMLGGILAGVAIVGMHYLGEVGVTNYSTTFSVASVVGATLIAVGAASTSLGLFFRFKSHWSGHTWKRLSCAALLALTVSSMHWVAVLGTTYRARKASTPSTWMSGVTAGWICGSMSLACCLILFAFMAVWQRWTYQTKQKAQEVTLSICVWDPDERLMLNAAGMIPSSRITKAYFDDIWDEDFQAGHPVFCWIYRVSRNWKCCTELIPRMRAHISSLKQAGTLEAENRSAQSHTTIFREQFCVAAADLAQRLDQPLEDLGILYDRVIATGTTKQGLSHILAPLGTPRGSLRDVESIATRIPGRGQTLYLVKHATKLECSRLQASGFAFAPIPNVVDGLARNSQMEVGELKPHLDSMMKYRPAFQALEPGVHVGVFCVKPNMYSSFDVLVDKRADNLLPAIQLRSVKRLERWQQDLISEYQDCKARDLMRILPDQAKDMTRTIQHRKFMTELVIVMGYLSNRIGVELFADTVLTATAYQGPCATVLDSEGNLTQATVFAFRLVVDIHTLQPVDAADEYIPFRLFACQQRVYSNSPYHASFASLVHQEFSGIEGRRSKDAGSERRMSEPSNVKLGKGIRDHFGIGLKRLSTSHSSPLRKGSATSEIIHDTHSEKSLVRDPAPNPFGGILVSNQVSISVTDRENDQSTPAADVLSSTTAVEVAASSKEKDCFADELLVRALRDHVAHQRNNQHRHLTSHIAMES